MENNQLDEIKRLLEENSQRSAKIEIRLRKIENYLKWQKIWTILKIVIISIPIILSLIYLPPLFREAFHGYQELLGPEGYGDLGL